jgi:imidazolonepropionase
MATLILRDIAELVTLSGPDGVPPDPAAAELQLGLVKDAAVVVVDGRIVFAGPKKDAPTIEQLGALSPPIIEESAGGRLVSPGLIDPHTHLIWAGERSLEFDLRNLGTSYQEIQRRGGGILSTVTATAQASDEALIAGMRVRLSRALSQGVTLCEVKTGYGLHPQPELRLLRLIHEAARGHAVAVSSTFLCHVPPAELTVGERPGFIAALRAALDDAAKAGAAAVDVYCDAGAFTLAETESLLNGGRAAGLRLRCHAEQFTYTGAAELASRLGAASVEHLEEIDDHGIAALAHAGVVANLLPGAALTLRLRWPDGRRLLRAGVRVALGTDCNPGSCHSESLPLMMTLGCTQMGLSAAEAWLGVTRHAARALGAKDAGCLTPGARGDLVVWEAERYREVCQHFGAPLVSRVFRAGHRVFTAA